MPPSQDSPNPKGLSSNQAQNLLKQFGANKLVADKNVSVFHQLIKIFSDPMGLMMLALSVLYFLTENKTDALIILGAYVPVTGVDVFLELRAERALSALRSNLQRTAQVFRDGKLTQLPIEFLVPGDLLAFEEGQTLPADGQVVEAHSLFLNESSLTGESIPLEKSKGSIFFAGSTVLTGRGLGQVQKTGRHTQFGNIAQLLNETAPEPSPLQKMVNRLVKKIAVLAAALVALLFCVEFFKGHGLVPSLITSLTFGMAALPEEFPLVFTLYLSLGAWRLSKHGVLVKNLPSVETLGNVDVICTDKTGTLTEGQFRLQEMIPFGSISPDRRALVALLACEPDPVDAMELAIFEKLAPHRPQLLPWTLIHDYPFDSDGKHMTHIWKNQSGGSLLAMKGAVEGVLLHCQMSEAERVRLSAEVTRLASEGSRLLGLATLEKTFSGTRLNDEAGAQFVGLLVFSDPVRLSAKKAIADCQSAGIQVKMLTGDHVLTAHAIADQLELVHTEGSIYTGEELTKLSPTERDQAYLNGALFARVSPAQKHELIQSLKAKNKVVAMTGDGVNDSPALRLADIGISMGKNATDVARATATMVLLENDLSGVVQAIFEGRRIFANLRRSFSYLISFHIPVVLLALLPPFLARGPLLLPVHIILLELLVHPVSAFAFENLKKEANSKSRKLLPTFSAATAALSGLLLSLVGLSWVFPITGPLDLDQAQGSAFVTLLFGNLGLVLVEAWPNLSSKRVLVIVSVLLGLPFALFGSETLLNLLHLTKMAPVDLVKILPLGLLASAPTFLLRLWLTNKSN